MDVVIYARVSQVRKSGREELSESVPNQIAKCRAWAEASGHRVVDVFQDEDVSATTGRLRPGFEALLAAKPPAIVGFAFDRLVRTMKDLERVLALEVPAYFVTAGAMDLSTPGGRMFARVITSLSQMEGELKAERIKLTNGSKRSQGIPTWNLAPFGFEKVGRTTFVVKESEAALVRELYRRFLEGETYGALGRWLTDQGHTTTAAHVKRLLEAERFAGYVDGVRAAWEPVVSEAVWTQAQALMEERRPGFIPNNRLSNLLSALPCVTCATCGRTLHVDTRRGRQVYVCPRKHITVGREELEGRVVEQVIGWYMYAGTLGRPEPEKIPLGDNPHLAELADVRGRLAEWEAVSDELGPGEYLRVTRGLRERLAELEAALKEDAGAAAMAEFAEFKPEGAPGPETLEKARELWDAMPLTRRRELVAHALQSVRVFPRGRGNRGPLRVEITAAGGRVLTSR